MELSDFTLRIFLIFFPGIIVFTLVDRLTVHEKHGSFQTILYSLTYGFITYIFYYLLSLIFRFDCTFFKYFIDKDQKLNFIEIIIVTGFSVPVGILFVVLIYYKVLYRFAKFFKISHKIGDMGVWTYVMTLNAKRCDSEWVNIIDRENMIMYYGFIEAHSDNREEEDEIFLRNVEVYEYIDDTIGNRKYMTPGLYLSKKRGNLIFEFPNMRYIRLDQKTTISLIKDLKKTIRKICLIINRIVDIIIVRVVKAYLIYRKNIGTRRKGNV